MSGTYCRRHIVGGKFSGDILTGNLYIGDVTSDYIDGDLTSESIGGDITSGDGTSDYIGGDLTSGDIMTGDVTSDYKGWDITSRGNMTGDITSGDILYWGHIMQGTSHLGTYHTGYLPGWGLIVGDIPSGANPLGTY